MGGESRVAITEVTGNSDVYFFPVLEVGSNSEVYFLTVGSLSEHLVNGKRLSGLSGFPLRSLERWGLTICCFVFDCFILYSVL